MNNHTLRNRIAILTIGIALIVGVFKITNDQVTQLASAELIYEGKWDQYQDLRGFYWQDIPPPEIVTDRVRSGTHALHSYLDVKIGSTRDRCELILGKDNNATPDTQGAIQLEFGKRYWFGISIYVPVDLPQIPDNLNDIVLQMHGKPDKDGDVIIENPRNPNLSLSVTGDGANWRVHTRGDNRRITPIDKSYQFSKAFNIPLEKGKWTDWVFEILLSYNDDGELNIWKDGQLIYAELHKNTWNDDRGPHISFGIYSWWADNNLGINTYREYWHDAFKLAEGENGYNVVSPDPIFEPTLTPTPTRTPTSTLTSTPTPTLTQTPTSTSSPTPTLTPMPMHEHQDIYDRLDAIETQQALIIQGMQIQIDEILHDQLVQRTRLKLLSELFVDIASLITSRLGE